MYHRLTARHNPNSPWHVVEKAKAALNVAAGWIEADIADERGPAAAANDELIVLLKTAAKELGRLQGRHFSIDQVDDHDDHQIPNFAPTPLEVLALSVPASLSLPALAGGAPSLAEGDVAQATEMAEAVEDAEYEAWLNSLSPADRLFHERVHEIAEVEDRDQDRDWESYAKSGGYITEDGLPPLWG